MKHFKLILALGIPVFAVVVLFVAATNPFSGFFKGSSSSEVSPLYSASTSEGAPANAFLPGQGNGGRDVSVAAGSNGVPATSSANERKNVIPANSANSTSVQAIVLPDVPDGDITIDPAGVSSPLAFLAYFNAHSADDIVFDNSRFNSALKDENGVVLFVPDLIDKAIADNNFSEVHTSLSIQKDFIAAEINFLKTIKVTGDAVALDKEVIGVENLSANLIDKAFAVQDGTLSENDFVEFYNQYDTTVSAAREGLIAQSGALSFVPEGNWLSWIGRIVGTTVEAQSVNTPFGGQIKVPVKCAGGSGYWVSVGPPKSASLFVSNAFIATPMFYQKKSMKPLAWWLGLYNSAVKIPCAPAPGGKANAIIMAGTGS